MPDCSGIYTADRDEKCRNADAGGIGLKADAQLWYFAAKNRIS
jgi:hypothetical protein